MKTSPKTLGGVLCVSAVLSMESVAWAQPHRPTPPTAPAPTDFIQYRVRAGDTCASIALRMYRDARRTDVVHTCNDLGPQPHHLTPGQMLRLPRRAPSIRGPVPDARLTAAHNRVEILSPEERPGHPNDPLFRGSRVSTQAQSTAEVTFADETQLRLSEQTLVVILGDTSSQAHRVATARDTTLVTGTLRAYLGALAGRASSIPVNTPAARVLLGSGEAQVQVDAHHATTLAVYHGRSRLRTRRRVVIVSEGFSVRAEEGHDPTPPRPLPAAAVWTTSPEGVVFASAQGLADVTGIYGPGAGGAPVAGWHLQLAHDPRFDDPVIDMQVPATVVRLEARQLPTGRYVARVSVLDAQGVEGPWSPEVQLVVASPRVVPAAVAHRASVELPAGTFCAVDQGTLTPTGVAPMIDTLRPHALRCAMTAEGAGTAATTLARERLGPLTAIARLVGADAAGHHGRVRVVLLDHAGEAVTDPGVTFTAPAGVVAEAPRAMGEAGVFEVPVTWPVGARTVTLHVAVGDESVDTPVVALPPPPPVPVIPQPTALHRFELRLEGAGGTVLTGFQQNTNPSAYQGITRGFGPVYGGAVRVDARLVGPLRLEVSAARWEFPTALASTGVATLYSGGISVTPAFGSVGRLVIEGSAGAVITGPYTRFGFDGAVGFEFALGPTVSLGPVVRYIHVVQPADNVVPYDAAFWTAGLSLSVRVPEPRSP